MTKKSDITHPQVDSEELTGHGLNLQHVFDIEALPDELLNPLTELEIPREHYRQLWMIGHGGKRLWNKIPKRYFERAHPVDSFCVDQLSAFMKNNFPNEDYRLLYPRHQEPLVHFNLQALGELAGWHFSSPFRVGINNQLGSWYAYRLLVLTTTELTPSPKATLQSPCTSCQTNDCIKVCPVNALSKNGEYDWRMCFDFRKTKDSPCRDRCLARIACPVQPDHQYTIEQIQYHYRLSRQHIGKIKNK